jgi:hypothetical protein
MGAGLLRLSFAAKAGNLQRMRTAAPFTQQQKQQCRDIVYEVAREFDIPPVFITAHIRGKKADPARRKVMILMITEVGLLRSQVAYAFNRDVRRTRKSVLGV